MYPIKYGIEGSVFFLNLILSFLSKRYIFTSWSIYSVFSVHYRIQGIYCYLYLEIDSKAYFRFMQVHSLSSIHTLPNFLFLSYFILHPHSSNFSIPLFSNSYFCPSHLILCLAFLSYHSLVFISYPCILEPYFLNLSLELLNGGYRD